MMRSWLLRARAAVALALYQVSICGEDQTFSCIGSRTPAPRQPGVAEMTPEPLRVHRHPAYSLLLTTSR